MLCSRRHFIRANSFGRRLIRRHTLRVFGTVVSAAIGVLAVAFRDQLGISGWLGFIMPIPILYGGSLAQAAINRHADEEKED